MKENELKSKIAEVVRPIIKKEKISCNEEDACSRCWFPCAVNNLTYDIANALISKGLKLDNTAAQTVALDLPKTLRIYDLERKIKRIEYENKVLQRALSNLCNDYDDESDNCVVPNSNHCNFSDGCVSCIQREYILRAEKQIEEEENG